ncbi:CAP domain-containing protein [Virgibacillus sp. W0430]|uniref:CAP domain-containing protein n=1 Tax=Virgibacillus sp. W0430 TaxID=3391580 RepID=UPI003F48D935
MRTIKLFVLIAFLVGGGYYLYSNLNVADQLKKSAEHLQFDQIKQKVKTKQVPERKRTKELMTGDLYNWIGMPSDELKEVLDEPDRKDKSAYGYTWWVYTNQEDEYIQFGIKNGEIVTIYGTGDDLSASPLEIGQSYEDVESVFAFSKEISYRKDISFYTFRLSAEDLRKQPLIQLEDDLYVQCYFDTFTNELSSLRILDADTLLMHRFYEIEYRGMLDEVANFSREEWEEIEKGMEQQIFDLTNVFRHRHEQSPLRIDEQASAVAFKHSKDMADNNYFSHYSQNGNGLKERLAAEEVFYIEAGENIAAQYSDAPAAMEGWLNSKGHREALLKENYTHLGIGVYRQYYTQNFLAKP